MDPFKPHSSVSYPTQADRLALGIRRVGAVRLTDIEPTRVDWLWPGRIPLGYVTLLVSDPGAGKSLISLDIAARISTGRPWPDAHNETQMTNNEMPAHSSCTPNPQSRVPSGCRNPKSPGSVLLLSIEDHFANTVRPRLDSLGADCSRIIGLSHVPGDGVSHMPRPLAINRDIDRLALLLREMGDCRLIILDPITAFFGDTSNRSTGNVWKVLSQLSWLAASANLAVLAISHIRKKEGAAIHRAMGSLAYIAAARAAWTISTDSADSSRRLFLPLKNNLAESAAGLAFKIERNPSNGGPVVRWLPETIEVRSDAVPAAIRELGRPDDERRYAVQFLRTRLSAGAALVRDVRADADAHGIGYGTLRRAFRDLGAEAIKQGDVKYGPWTWKLPGQGAQKPVGEFSAP
jgi:putative DNA primase/helicase